MTHADTEPTTVTCEDDIPVESVLLGENLELRYRSNTEPVVDCARLDIPEGAVTALVGPNGSGKSTILKALSKQLQPTAGEIRLHGRNVRSYDHTAFARELGFLTQEHESPSEISVAELVAKGRYPYRDFFGGLTDTDHEAIELALSLTGIEHLRETELAELSGGQTQLAWIAMVLAQETDVLLLDEPTTFLDLHNQFRVLETIRTLNQQEGLTVAVVLHDITQAARFADYVIALDDGQLYDWGVPEAVVTEQLLSEVFNVEATVRHDPELQVLPRRALRPE